MHRAVFPTETNLSQAVQNLFIYGAGEWGILRMSIREAAIPSRQPTDLLFLFYPPFSNLCSESAKRRRLVSPNERRRFASVSPEAYSFRREGLCQRFALRPDRTGPDEGDAPRISRGCIPGSVPMRAGARFSGVRLPEILIKISEKRQGCALAETRGMRYTKNRREKIC